MVDQSLIVTSIDEQSRTTPSYFAFQGAGKRDQRWEAEIPAMCARAEFVEMYKDLGAYRYSKSYKTHLLYEEWVRDSPQCGRLDIDDPRRTIYGKTLSQCSVKFHAQDIL